MIGCFLLFYFHDVSDHVLRGCLGSSGLGFCQDKIREEKVIVQGLDLPGRRVVP